AMARPTVALVNNAQRQHQELMATVDAVARENGSVIEALPDSGVAVFPADEPFTPIWRAAAASRTVLTFAESGEADVTGAAQWTGGAWKVNATTPQGRADFSLQVAGRHNVKNALAATACALAAGVPLSAIAAGLSSFSPVKGRSRALQVTLAGRAITLIDDSYNANPDSVRAAIDVLAELPGPRLLVLGDMGEVGDQGPAFHAEVGVFARERGIEQLFTLGKQSGDAAASFGAGRHFGDDLPALQAAVAAALPGLGSALVKGSRFMRMERVVEAIAAGGQEKQLEKK
ncbi:MAG: Mur ligase family protein, partial [Polaromonas sp.]|nr:Mur ligase family protein [Polaromonas sp.]